MNLKVCEIASADIADVLLLWENCKLTRPWNDASRDIAFAMANDNSTVLVGKQHGKLVACAMVGHDGHRGAIYYLAVDPEFQSEGHGTAIHAAAEVWLKAKGVWKINLMFRSENEKVRGFYERLGYTAEGGIFLDANIEHRFMHKMLRA